jgi:fatty acid desaturase
MNANLTPRVTPAAARVDALHRALAIELGAAGCFRPAPVRTAGHAAIIAGGYAAGYAVLLHAPALWLRLPVLVALAFLTVQAGFVAHQAGHLAITRHRALADALGQLFHTFFTALCYSYFQHIHRRHHPHCNDRSRDPDMQSDFVSMYAESAREKRGFARWITRRQGALVWALIWLQGFTLKIDSLRYLAREPRATRVDQAFLALHFAFWFLPPLLVLGAADAFINYAVMTLFIGAYTGCVFVVNHVGTRVIEPGEKLSYFHHEIAVTRNLGDSWLDDLVFGGVNNHIEHHLFPAMPSARLRAARRVTRAFCARHGIAYREMSWLDGAREVTRHFSAMARHAEAA